MGQDRGRGSGWHPPEPWHRTEAPGVSPARCQCRGVWVKQVEFAPSCPGGVAAPSTARRGCQSQPLPPLPRSCLARRLGARQAHSRHPTLPARAHRCPQLVLRFALVGRGGTAAQAACPQVCRQGASSSLGSQAGCPRARKQSSPMLTRRVSPSLLAGRASPGSLSLQAGCLRARRQGIPELAGKVSPSTPSSRAGCPRAQRQSILEPEPGHPPAPGGRRQGVPQLLELQAGRPGARGGGKAARLPPELCPMPGGGRGAAQPPSPGQDGRISLPQAVALPPRPRAHAGPQPPAVTSVGDPGEAAPPPWVPAPQLHPPWASGVGTPRASPGAAPHPR